MVKKKEIFVNFATGLSDLTNQLGTFLVYQKLKDELVYTKNPSNIWRSLKKQILNQAFKGVE